MKNQKNYNELYRLISPAHDDIHKSLIQWEKWCRVKWHPQCVQSLEGRYRPPPMYEEPIPSNPPDVLLAHRIEALIATSPHNYGKHLRLWYIRHLPMKAVEKRLKMAICNIPAHLFASREFIKKHLTIQNNSLESPMKIEIVRVRPQTMPMAGVVDIT